MKTAEFTKLIKGRRSIRSFQDKPVPEELLMQAIELATWAPNAGNRQNWRFYIILDKNTINQIAESMQSVNRTISSWPEMATAMPRPSGAPPAGPPDGGPPSGGPRLLGRPDVLRQAPAVIAIASKQYIHPIDKIIAEKAKTDPKAKQIIDGVNIADTRIQSVSAAIAYLQLALYQLSLGSVWMTIPTLAKAEIEKILKVPQEYDFVALLPVGCPAESPTRERKPVSEVIQVIK